MPTSDFQINSGVRSILAKHWIDLKKVQVGAFHGTVRLTGELSRLGGECGSGHEERLIDTLELEIRALRGVARVYFDVTNWKRGSSGEWICTDPGARGKGSASTGAGETMVMEVRSPPPEPSKPPTPATTKGRL